MPMWFRSKSDVYVEKDYYGVEHPEDIAINYLTFHEPIDLINSKFLGQTEWVSSVFKRSALFYWTQFENDATFSRITFERDARFIRAYFAKQADFIQCKFYLRTIFYGAQFKGKTSFPSSRFHGIADFSFSQFDQEVRFGHSRFLGLAKFNDVQFGKGADFSQVMFDSIADFSNARIQGKLEFSQAKLPYYLDLSGINYMNGEVNLLNAKLGQKYQVCLINLVDTDISKIQLTYDDFQLYFPHETHYDDRVKVYQGLLKNFTVNGHGDSFRKLDIEFAQFKYEAQQKKTTSLIQRIWWNYGYDKNLIFVWIFRIILFFTVINTFFIRDLVKSVNQLPFLSVDIVEKHALHHPIIAYFLNFPGTLVYTFVIILSGATGLGIIKDYAKIPNFIWMLYMLVVSIIGLSLSIFIFNYVINK